MVWNWLRRHPHLIDLALVLALGAVTAGRAERLHGWDEGLPLVLVEVLPLVARRRFPIAVLALVTCGSIAELVSFSSAVPLAAMVAIYTVAAHVPRPRALAAGAAATAAISLSSLAVDNYHQAASLVVLLAAAWVLGDNLGTRRAYTRTLEERAARLERERESEAARAVAEEQARIGRELHDVIAHNLSVMVVQAAAANDVFDRRPERAREALQAIESTGRGALSELRRLLGSVRGEVGFAPQPGLAQLDDLVGQVRAAGLAVDVHVEGEPRTLPRALELSAYRVVQEALTNTLKHAHASRADVSLRYADDALGVEVRDDGSGNGHGDGAGRGLIGMRERVGTFGGSLATGPAAEGGFAVAATFPVEAGA